MDFQEAPKLTIQQEKHRFETIVDNSRLFIDRSFYLGDMQYRLALKGLHVFETMGALVFAGGGIAYSVYLLLQTPPVSKQIDDLLFDISMIGVWGGILCLLFVWYRVLANKKTRQYISSAQEATTDAEEEINVWRYFTPASQRAVERSITLAYEWHNEVVTEKHLFAAMLEDTSIQVMLRRLSLSVATLQDICKQALAEPDRKKAGSPTLTPTTQATLLHSYTIAETEKLPEIDVTELFMSTIIHSSQLQELLYDMEVEYHKVQNMLAWLRTQAELKRRRTRQARGASHLNKHGLDRAMTAVATPFLNQYSTDITYKVKFGALAPCVAREKEIADIFRIIESGRPNIVLVGERGVGKRAIIEGIAARIVAGDVPKVIQDKRIVEISVSSLVAGTTVSGAQERLLRMITEITRARNIIVFIDNIHDLVDPADTGVDVSKTLAEVTSQGHFYTFATTTLQGYTQQIAHSAIGSTLADVDVVVMEENQAIQVLESKAPYIEYRQKVFFSYQSLETAVRLADKFLQEQPIPESAIGIMTEAASIARAARGESTLVEAEDVAIVVSKKTGVPVAAITDDESTKLLRLEEALHEHVVGQTEAVQMVANALRRARAAIRSNDRPIATFLFLGPTGVGKTELAKTIANEYFGGEERMIRIDMSEYQDSSAVYRLIGQPGQQGTGQLTEAVRQQPFSLILLDEMEKADPNVLNIFLQVFDDGRLTDSVGRTVDFTNSIIVATSNAATSYVQSELANGTPYENIQHALLHGQLQEYYRPEFLNRFDGIILFKSLTTADITQIAGLLLQRLQADIAERGIDFKVEPAALDALAAVGYDPEFGARPMRRAIQERVENTVAELLLSRTVKRRDTIVLRGDLTLDVISPN